MDDEKNGFQTKIKSIKKILEYKDALKLIITGLVGFAVAIMIFGAGIKIGEFKARYSYRWAENYQKNFAGPKQGFLKDCHKTPPQDFIGEHGVFGEIIAIKDNELVINGRDNMEKIIVINNHTSIIKGREKIKDGLKIGDHVVIIGSPNKTGQIEAKLIRIFNEDMTMLPSFSPQSKSLFKS